jgi:hypothetical protein
MNLKINNILTFHYLIRENKEDGILTCDQTKQWKFINRRYQKYTNKCLKNRSLALLNIKNPESNNQKRRIAELITTGRWYL